MLALKKEMRDAAKRDKKLAKKINKLTRDVNRLHATVPVRVPRGAVSSEAGIHVDPLAVDASFVQSSASCVCASYAVAASYFTGLPFGTWFVAYCKHFDVHYKDEQDAQDQFSAHFDAEWRRRKCRGYEVLLDLHRYGKTHLACDNVDTDGIDGCAKTDIRL